MDKKARRKCIAFFVLIFFLFFLYTSMNCSLTASFSTVSGQCNSSALHQQKLHNSLDSMSSLAVQDFLIRNNVVARAMRVNKEKARLRCLLNLFAIAFAIVLFPILIYGTARYFVKGCHITRWSIIVFLHQADGKKKSAYTSLPME